MCTAHAICTGAWTDSVHCTCTLHLWVPLQRTLNRAPVISFTVYTVIMYWTCQGTDSVHYSCCILHAHPVCACSVLCTALTHRGVLTTLLAHEVQVWIALRVYHVRQLCIAVQNNFCNLQFSPITIRLWWKTYVYGTFLCLKLWIAATFRDSIVPSQQLTAWVAMNGLMDVHHCTWFPLYEWRSLIMEMQHVIHSCCTLKQKT